MPLVDTSDGLSAMMSKHIATKAKEKIDNILTVATNHIYTILNVIVCNQTTGDVLVGLQFAPGGSGTCIIFADQALPASGTYVWSDKLVLTAGDIVKVTCSAADHDVYISYIDQDWT